MTLADMIRAEVPHNNTLECECGRPKSSGARCCARCRYLDGETPHTGAVIDSLRGTDGMSLTEIVEAIDGVWSLSGYRSVQRTCKTLLEQGRVRRYWCEQDAFYCKGTGRQGAGDGHWVYALWAATERRAA